jgi:hypothetical protein
MTISWQEAEDLAVIHMHVLGFTDARKTAGGADRGIDAVSVRAVAQVKLLSQPVGSPDIQRLKGAAHDSKNVLFYSSAGYSRAAISVADELGIALFSFSPSTLEVVAVNDHAKRVHKMDDLDNATPEQVAHIAECMSEFTRLHSEAGIILMAFGERYEDAQRERGRRWNGMDHDVEGAKRVIPQFQEKARIANELLQQQEFDEAVDVMREANAAVVSWFNGARVNDDDFVPYRRAALERARRGDFLSDV